MKYDFVIMVIGEQAKLKKTKHFPSSSPGYHGIRFGN